MLTSNCPFGLQLQYMLKLSRALYECIFKTTIENKIGLIYRTKYMINIFWLDKIVYRKIMRI